MERADRQTPGRLTVSKLDATRFGSRNAPVIRMNTERKAYLIGGGIGSLAAAAFMVRDGALPGANISIFEVGLTLGGSLDGAQVPTGGYSLRGGRMLTTDNYECTWDLYKSIPSPMSECNGTEVLQELLKVSRNRREMRFSSCK